MRQTVPWIKETDPKRINAWATIFSYIGGYHRTTPIETIPEEHFEDAYQQWLDSLHN
jgi:hypothetical protein